MLHRRGVARPIDPGENLTRGGMGADIEPIATVGGWITMFHESFTLPFSSDW